MLLMRGPRACHPCLHHKCFIKKLYIKSMKYRKEGKAKQSERLCMEELRSSIDVLKFIQLPLLQLIQLMVEKPGVETEVMLFQQ